MQLQPDSSEADEWQEGVSTALQGDNEAMAAICMMMASFHRGEIDAGSAIDNVLNVDVPQIPVVPHWLHLVRQLLRLQQALRAGTKATGEGLQERQGADEQQPTDEIDQAVAHGAQERKGHGERAP